MNKRKYYYLIAGLPDLIPDDKKLVYTSVRLREYLQEELHPDDFKLVEMLYLPWDHDNLVKLIYKEEFVWDERGNFPKDFIEQLIDRKQYELIDASDLPGYLIDFIEYSHNSDEDLPKSKAIRMLTEGWYNYLQESENKFVRELASYKQTIGNLVLA